MKLVVFDIDGTLTDTAGDSDSAFLDAVAETAGVERVSASWADYGDGTDATIARAMLQTLLNQEPTQALLDTLKASYMRLLRKRLVAGSPIRGAAEFLSAMGASSDWMVAVATGNWQAAAVHKLTVSGLFHREIPMATADDFSRRRDILRKAIELAGPVNGVVYVGDRHWDLHAARDVGVGFLAIGQGVSDATVSFPDFARAEELEAALNDVAR